VVSAPQARRSIVAGRREVVPERTKLDIPHGVVVSPIADEVRSSLEIPQARWYP
jgi:hypothetical protein